MSLTEPPKLSGFVNATRDQKSKGVLSAERVAKLDAVGFMWQGKDYKIGKDGMCVFKGSMQQHLILPHLAICSLKFFLVVHLALALPYLNHLE